MNLMTHKGYQSRIEYDSEDRIFTGRLIGIRDIITFHGDSVNSLEAAFHEAVNDYLKACEQLGQQPEKPVSGNLMLRVPPEVHQAAIAAARASGASLNQWAAKVLAEAARA